MKFLKNIGSDAMQAGLAVGGGALSRVFTNKVTPMIPVVKNYKKLAPLPAFLVGVALMGNKKTHYLGVGMAAVAGTDMAAEFVPMLKHTDQSVNGIQELPERLADELEKRLSEDVNDAAAALNENVNASAAVMNEQLSEDINALMNEDDVIVH